MLSALIPSVGRKPAVPLAGQLAHESYVRPGPLVLGTAFRRSPTAAPDRDRHSCYHRQWLPGARSFLPGSACRHADRTISSPQRGARRMVSEDSGHRTDPVFPADCPHLSPFHSPSPSRHPIAQIRSWRGLDGRVAQDSRSFQQIAKFIDSAGSVHCLTTF